MSHKDKTFCPFTDCVKECERKLTEEVDREIKESGNPIIDVYTDKPECYTKQQLKPVEGI